MLMNRNIKYIVVHCSAGNQHNKAADILHYHLKVKKWSKPGYHYFIEEDGNIVQLLDEEISSNGVNAQINPISINVCYAGGVDTTLPDLPPVDNRTEAQKRALRALLCKLKQKFRVAKIVGHRKFAAKACPSFDAETEYSDIL